MGLSDFFLHSSLEAISASLCLWIARHAWSRYKELPNAFHALWATAFVLAGVVDLIHAAWSLVDRASAPVWVPFTWALSRTFFLVFLLLGSWWSHRKPPTKGVWVSMIGVVTVVSFLCLTPVLGGSQEWVYQTTGPVYRPADGVLALLSGLLLIAVLRKPDTMLMVPRWFAISLSFGFLSHIVMCFFSTKSMDTGFFVGHVLKVVEYLLWSAALLVEGRRVAEVGLRRMLDEKAAATRDGAFAALDRLQEELDKSREIRKKSTRSEPIS